MAEGGFEHSVDLEPAVKPIAEQEPGPTTIKYIVKIRVNSLIERLSAEKLAELDSLLADFDHDYLLPGKRPLISGRRGWSLAAGVWHPGAKSAGVYRERLSTRLRGQST